MTNHVFQQFFLESVLPEIPDEQAKSFFKHYPEISFTAQAEIQPLYAASVLMLVALTGTGKSTTLGQLEEYRISGAIHYQETIPSRRDIADFIIIPTAQKLLGETIQPVKDRVQRFFYTRTFAEHVQGGMAAAYSWLFLCSKDQTPIISEGIRGADEISFGLENCPHWHIVELTVNPITRLKRLSTRSSEFDRAAGTDEVSFLPMEIQGDVAQAIHSGEITPTALSIVRAEGGNYGLEPYNKHHPRYRCIDTEMLSPEEVANEVRHVLEAMMSHATH